MNDISAPPKAGKEDEKSIDKVVVQASSASDLFDSLLQDKEKNKGKNKVSSYSTPDNDKAMEIFQAEKNIEDNSSLVKDHNVKSDVQIMKGANDISSDDDIEEISVTAASKSAKSSDVHNEIRLELADTNDSEIDEDEGLANINKILFLLLDRC